MEIVETGALRRVDAERTEDVAAIQVFQGIYGVGMRYVPQSLGLAVLIRPARSVDRICLVPCRLPHA